MPKNSSPIPPDPFGQSNGMVGQPGQAMAGTPQKVARKTGTSKKRAAQSATVSMPTQPAKRTPAPSPVPMPQPASSGKQSKKQAKASKQTQQKQKVAVKQRNGAVAEPEATEPKIGFFSRLRGAFRENGVRGMFYAFCEWIDKNAFVPLVISVIFIALGLLFSRYFSFGCAMALVIFGMILSRQELPYGRGDYMCYIAAGLAFIVPYLF